MKIKNIIFFFHLISKPFYFFCKNNPILMTLDIKWFAPKLFWLCHIAKIPKFIPFHTYSFPSSFPLFNFIPVEVWRRGDILQQYQYISASLVKNFGGDFGTNIALNSSSVSVSGRWVPVSETEKKTMIHYIYSLNTYDTHFA